MADVGDEKAEITANSGASPELLDALREHLLLVLPPLLDTSVEHVRLALQPLVCPEVRANNSKMKFKSNWLGIHRFKNSSRNLPLSRYACSFTELAAERAKTLFRLTWK